MFMFKIYGKGEGQMHNLLLIELLISHISLRYSKRDTFTRVSITVYIIINNDTKRVNVLDYMTCVCTL